MIKIRDVEILDLLPYTYKTPENKALSRAIAKITSYVYDMLSSVIFWADINSVENSALLDAMAAELDCPFYSSDMPIEQKRSIISAMFIYNSRIGTKSAVEKLIEAAFGGGEVSEWYEYGGDPYYFKVKIIRAEKTTTSYNNYEYFLKMLEKVKNKRSKLEGITVNESINGNVYFGSKIARIRRYTKIQSV